MFEVPAGHLLARRIAVLITGVLVIMLAEWVRSDPRLNLTTDWTAFDNAADRVIAGDTVYRPYSADAEPLPYLYPPFVLWLALPLAMVGFFGSFAMSFLGPLAAYVAGLRWFGKAETGSVDRSTGVIVGVASGATIGSSLIGQYSGIYVLAFGAAALLYTKDRRVWAGVVLALLWIKPNIAVAVPVVLLWSRSWRMLKGFAGGTVALVLLSLPFGVQQWSGFLANARMMAELQEEGVVPFHKMVTVLGSIQTVFGLDSTSPMVLATWVVVAGLLGVAILVLWTPDRLSESPVRAFGALALFVIAANPRMYFYDATLAVLGMFGVWMSAQVCGGALARRWTPRLAILLWLGLWGNVFASLNRFVGPVVAVALLVTAIDSWRADAASVGRNLLEGPFEASQPAMPTQNAA